MKHLIRKPMLAILLLFVMAFGTAFMAFFRADIAAGWAQIDRLYNETQVTVEIVPEAGWGNMQMKTHKSILIEGMPEIGETLSVMECEYILRDGSPLVAPDMEDIAADQDALMGYEPGVVEMPTDTVHGTNNIAWLTEYWDLNLVWLDGWTADDFRVRDGVVPCLVGQALLEKCGLVPGDTVSISPTNRNDRVSVQAPTFDILIVGTVDSDTNRVGEMDILVPQECFLGEPKLFYNSDMMYRCYYRAYHITESKVKTQLHRTRKKLQQYLAKEGIHV